jgi:serine/threonine protein kinase/tetratricopeptide (TPR) repeat protein
VKLTRYDILEKIGEGGMGIVYKARDRRLGRIVAVKALPAAKDSAAEHRARLLREAQAASSLNHPAIVTLHDVGSEDGVDFLVMEYVEGRPLNQLIPGCGLTIRDAVDYGAQIAEALAAAHAAGIIHRDLKPANVIVTPSGRIKLLDFGLAKQIVTDKEQGLTSEGIVLGTLAYMSPEQAVGQSLDQRSDIFSLGVLLYQMLAGVVPFQGEHIAASIHELFYGEPTPLRQLRPEVPDELDRIVSTALRTRREERYQHAADLAGELRGLSPADLLDADTAARISRPDAPTGPVGRSDALAAAGRPRSRPPSVGSERASLAVLPFRSLSDDKEDAHTATGISLEIASALSGVPDLRIASQLASFRFQGDVDLKEVARALNIRYVLTGSFRRAGDRVRVLAELTDATDGTQVWSRKFERDMADLFAMQEEIAGAIVTATGGQLIRATSQSASYHPPENLDAWGLLRKAYHFWNFNFSLEGLDEALTLLRRAVKLDPRYADAHAFLGMYLVERVIHAFTPHKEEERTEALAAVERALELAPGDPSVLENAGLVLLHCSHWERSVTTLRRAVAIAPFNLVAWGYLALSLGWGGDDPETVEAERILARLVEAAPEHPSLPYWLYFRSGVAARQARFEDAAAYASRTLDLHPYFFIARTAHANALGTLGQREAGLEAWKNVQAINPTFTASHYAGEIAMIARYERRIEPHLAGLRALGVLDAV